MIRPVQNAGTVCAVEEKGRETQRQIVEVALIGETHASAYPTLSM